MAPREVDEYNDNDIQVFHVTKPDPDRPEVSVRVNIRLTPELYEVLERRGFDKVEDGDTVSWEAAFEKVNDRIFAAEPDSSC